MGCLLVPFSGNEGKEGKEGKANNLFGAKPIFEKSQNQKENILLSGTIRRSGNPFSFQWDHFPNFERFRLLN